MQFDNGKLVGEWTLPPLAKDRNTAILFIHGLCSSWREVGTFPQLLAEQGIRFFGFDLSGHGASAGTRGLITEASMTNDTQAALAQMRKDFSGRIFTMGHSFGTHQALRLAAATAEVDGAILIAPRVESGASLRGLKAVAFKGIGTAYRAFPFLPGISIRREGQYCQKINLKTLALASHLCSRACLQKMHKPVMVVAGANDQDTPEIQSQEVFSLLSALPEMHKCWLCLPNSGHSPFGEADKTELAQSIAAFVKEP